MEKLSQASNQVSKLVGVLVEHQNFFEPLSTEDRQWAIQNPKEAIGLFGRAIQDRNSRVISNLNTIKLEIFCLSVDYGMSLKQMIAAGRFDQVAENIMVEHFPLYGNGIVEFEAQYFYFGRRISSEEVEEIIKKVDVMRPWSPAKIEHLLSLSVAFPEEQHKYPIFGLGSANLFRTRESSCTAAGDPFSPYLVWDVSARALGLYKKSYMCQDVPARHNPESRFLAVRKVIES